jgi:hypothetical protein
MRSIAARLGQKGMLRTACCVLPAHLCTRSEVIRAMIRVPLSAEFTPHLDQSSQHTFGNRATVCSLQLLKQRRALHLVCHHLEALFPLHKRFVRHPCQPHNNALVLHPRLHHALRTVQHSFLLQQTMQTNATTHSIQQRRQHERVRGCMELTGFKGGDGHLGSVSLHERIVEWRQRRLGGRSSFSSAAAQRVERVEAL